MINNTLRKIPKLPRIKLVHQTVPNFLGFLMKIHMRHGYAKVTGNAIPPIRSASWGKKGAATAMKNTNPPKNILSPVLNHHAQGFLVMLTHRSSKLSKTGIA